MIIETTPRKQIKPEWDLQIYGTTKEEFDRKANEILMQKEEKNQEEYIEQGEKEKEQL